MRRPVALELVQIAQDLVSLVAAQAPAPDVPAAIGRAVARLEALRATIAAKGLV